MEGNLKKKRTVHHNLSPYPWDSKEMKSTLAAPPLSGKPAYVWQPRRAFAKGERARGASVWAARSSALV
ncbi:unnamed protein product [Lampetra fluviatilis]